MNDQKQAKTLESIEQFGQALSRLKEIQGMDLEQKAVLRDATIQRFEFVFELCWKCLKRCLFVEGIESYTPKETLRRAYQSHWLEDEQLWLDMLDDRNLTSHIYNEETAAEIYGRISRYAPELERIHLLLKHRFAD
ncbi:MAG: nucleotidyltransferase substrate binding protein [Armatimonadetes bacterium]|nr:nucleotidyltransferase substrate binding protein [Armatimonadota bacterium]